MRKKCVAPMRGLAGFRAASYGPRLYATGKVLFRILLACLSHHQYDAYFPGALGHQTFAGFPTFAPITFHLFVSYSLIALRRAWLYSGVSHWERRSEGQESTNLVFSKLSIVHILLIVSASLSLGFSMCTGPHTLYQCFFTLPSVRVGKDFAISAQLFPASRIFLSLSSSAGVHGVFVRLFLGGGSMGAAAMTGSPMPGAEDAGATGVDMTMEAPGARLLLFRAAVCWGDDASGLTAGLSPAPGCAKN